jgi:predicted ATPase
MIEQQLQQLRPEDQTILEAASAVGAEFSAAAIAAGVEHVTEAVEIHCAALARRGQFLEARGTAAWPDGTIAARYGFIHALCQEVLYDRIPAGRRVRVHQRIGTRLEAGYGAQARTVAAELAAHFVRGRDARNAMQYLQYAGENALRRSAHQETVTHLTMGLELLEALAATTERKQLELNLLTTLGPALIATKGYAAPEVQHAYTRAHELCQQMGETRQLFPVLMGLYLFYHVRGGLQAAREVAEKCLQLAQHTQDSGLLLEAHRAVGVTLFCLGEFASARTDVAQSIALYDPERHDSHAFVYGVHPGVTCRSYEVWALWFLGYPGQALTRSDEVLTFAQELSHPFSLALARTWAAFLHQFRQEGHLAQDRAEAVVTLATEQGFPFFLAWGMVLRGWALAAQGQEEGVSQMHHGMVAHRATGAELGRTLILAMLAEAYGKTGQADEGLALLVEAQGLVDKNGERLYEAELLRLKGELLFSKSSDNQTEAETCFQQALFIAQSQQAKSLELRAAASLARLWQVQGRRQSAYDLLAKVYNWFTEGFDTADLKEAKALLEELEA